MPVSIRNRSTQAGFLSYLLLDQAASSSEQAANRVQASNQKLLPLLLIIFWIVGTESPAHFLSDPHLVAYCLTESR